MAFIPFPNSVKLELVWTLGGQEVVVTLGVRTPSTVTPANLEDIVDIADAWRIADLNELMADDATIQYIKATDLTTSSSPTFTKTTFTSPAGTLTDQALPNNAAAVITFITDKRGRSYRGRNYFPGATISKQAGETTFTSGYASALASAYAFLASGLEDNDYEHVVLSRQENNTPRITGVATPVTAYRCDQFIDSQRRRLAGRGV